MSYYNVCPICHANLDPGEKCECKLERERKHTEMQKLLLIGCNGQMIINFEREEAV
jgi:hypothetical protein